MHTQINRWVLFSSALLMGFVGHPDTAQAQNGIAFSPNQVVLTSNILTPGLQTIPVTVTVNGLPATSLSGTGTVNFLSTTPTVGPNQSILTVIANTAGLQPGTYNGAINVTANGINATLPVTLTIYGSNSITLSTTSLTFNGSTGGTPPPSQTVTVNGSVPGIPFNVSVATTSGGTWLTAAQTSTSVPATVTVTANPGNLAAGTYTGTVTITSDQIQPQVINVTLVVSGQPFLVVNPSPISLLYQTGVNAAAPSVNSQVLSTGFPINFNGQVIYNTCPNFFTVTGLSGNTGGSLMVTANLAAIGTATQCSGSIILTPTTSGTQGAVTVPVTFQSSASPLISVTPSFGSFMYSVGGAVPLPQTFTVSYSSSTFLPYSLASSAPWILLPATPAGGFTSSNFTVSLNPSALATMNPATYTANITVTALGAASSFNLPITLTISNNALITVSPSFLNFNYQTVATGGQTPSPLSFNVASTMSSVPFTIAVPTSTSSQFVSLVTTNGTATTSGTPVIVALNQGVLINLAPGIYQNQVQVTGGGTVQTVTINLNVSTTPLVNVNPQQLTFTYAAGGSGPPSQQLTFSSTNGSALPVTFSSNQNFLLVGGGSVNTPGSIVVSVLPGLAVGTYSAQITVASGTQTTTVPVTLTVTSGISISATPASLSFTQTVGGTAPATQTVAVATTNSSALAYSVAVSSTTGTNFITVNGSAATAQLNAPATFTVGANGSGLAAGTYTGTVTITAVGATNPTLTIPVTLTVAAQSLAVSPTTLSFTGNIFGTTPGTQTINVTSTTGSSVAFTASATTTTTSGGNFITVTPTSGTTPANITVTVSTAGLAAGTYNGAVSITSTAVGSVPVTIPVTFTVGSQAMPTIAQFFNAATNAPGPIAPGELVSIYGTNLGPVSPLQTTLTSSGGVSTNVGNVQVLFDGIAAPLTYISATQINAVVPYEIAGRATTTVTVNYNSVNTASLQLTVAATSPGLFVGTGGQAASLNQNGSFNAAATPAPKGSTIVLYATGEGQTSPLGVTGSVTGATLKNPVAPVTVTIGGVPATVAYAGSAPGFVSGVLQLNVVVPTGAPSGAAVPIVVTIGTASSPTTATVAIQ